MCSETNALGVGVINMEAFKKAWFTYEQIQSIIRWNEQVNIWNIYTEEEFYSRLKKRIHSKQKVYV